MRLGYYRLSFFATCVALLLPTFSFAQEKEPSPAATKVVIADEPKTIDPATLVSPPLATKVTIAMENKSLKDIVNWIHTEQKLEVLLNQQALTAKNILVSEEVNDHLQDDPLYLLLDRLESLGLSWYQQDGNLHITTTSEALKHITTIPYNVGHLIDAGYTQKELTQTIQESTHHRAPHAETDKECSVVLLGDVLFVRQTDSMHRQVSGILAALRKPARQTFTLDPPQHAKLREALNKQVSVSFSDTPLTNALEELSEKAQVDIRLDKASLGPNGVRDRVPVTLELAEQKLSTVLQSMLTNLNLTWILRDGVLWITPRSVAEGFYKTAVYDVQDLCNTPEETESLKEAIVSQTRGPWNENDAGPNGSIVFPKPSVMVVRQTEQGLGDVLSLLENYRLALRESKPRGKKDPTTTRYYRVPTEMAQEIVSLLPELLPESSWLDEKKKDGLGTIRIVKSTPSILFSSSVLSNPVHEGAEEVTNSLLVPHSVLIIKQSRETHSKIGNLISKLLEGDELQDADMKSGGMGGMGGGFGGGMFAVPDSGNAPSSKRLFNPR